ncbi:MAG: hypothetical protein QM811_29770 [Pirellulales bacterium]
MPAVPLHPALRWRMLRQRMIPLVVFGLCAVGAIWMWGHSFRIVHGWGEVYAPPVPLSAPFAGRILPAEDKPWKMYDYIRAGQVFVRLEALDGSGAIVPIVAPVDGYITELGPLVGQTIVPGGILAGLTPQRGDYILGYLQNTVAVTPAPYSPVIVRTRGATITEFTSQIEQIGPLDAGDRANDVGHHRKHNRPLGGLPVRVTIPQNVQLRPGELVDLASGAARRSGGGRRIGNRADASAERSDRA